MKAWVLPLALLAFCNHPKTTVGAAISLKESMEAIHPRLEKSRGHAIEFAFGASGDLASQMDRGAPFDVLATAGDEPRLHAIADERCTLAWNTLVLVHRKDTPTTTWTTLDRTPPAFRLAIGLTPQVPAGVYAEEALHALGEWDAVAPKIVRGTNVRHVLDLVARGEADAGIVYATDVAIRPEVESLGEVPDAARPNVRYPVWVAKSASQDARAIAALLCDDETKRALVSHGFLDHPPKKNP
ncbi:MAG TPA: molybdate ABC transporter substrate-binding protein [Polyangiaceae bacterium]|jgi:molybdate transport system substrate-binding protein